MNIIIVGDKYQKGMKSKGCVGLIKHNNNETLFDNQYRILRDKFPKSKITYIYGFDHKRFINYFKKRLYNNINLLHNKYYDQKNTGFSLNLANTVLDSDTLIVLGNITLRKNIFNKFCPNDKSQIFIDTYNKISNIGCIVTNNIISNISPELNNNLCEIYYLSKTDSILLQNLVKQNKYNNYFLFELINKIIESGSQIVPYITQSKISITNMVNK